MAQDAYQLLLDVSNRRNLAMFLLVAGCELLAQHDRRFLQQRTIIPAAFRRLGGQDSRETCSPDTGELLDQQVRHLCGRWCIPAVLNCLGYSELLHVGERDLRAILVPPILVSSWFSRYDIFTAEGARQLL